MRHLKTSFIWTLVSLIGMSMIAPIAASAASSQPGSGQALEIAPPLIYLTVNPGQVITTQIQVRNIASVPVVVSGQADDFVAGGENGIPKLLMGSNYNDPYSMKSWVHTAPSVYLQPGKTRNIPVTIDVPRDASPGGHYAVYRFSSAAPTINGKNGVSLSASLGSLILLTVSGKLVENMSVNKFYTSGTSGHPTSFFQSEPVVINEVFKNSGNVHLQPAGMVTIKDMFGKALAVINVNPEPGNILPDSLRKFTQTLDSTVIGKHRLFGRYTVDLSVTYGTKKETLTDALTFWVIPVKLIVGIVIGLIGGFFLLRWLIKRYNQHILDKAQKARAR